MAQNVNVVAARASAYLTKKLLKVADYKDIYGQFGATPIPRKDRLPMNSTKTAQWRRYELPSPVTTPMTEGVTPDGNTLVWTDITVNLVQYGDFIYLSDVSMDTVEDALVDIVQMRQETQAIQSITRLREGVLVAGTSINYANGSARTDVNTLITKANIARVERDLANNLARKLTSIIKASTGIDTHPIPESFIGVISPYTKYDFENTIQESGGYIPVHKYAGMDPIPGEIGMCSNTRYVVNPDMQYFADGGGNKGTGHKSTSAVKEDVFVTLVFGEESYGCVGHGGYSGKDNTMVIVKPLGSAGTEDPLNQRASVGWKTFMATKRLNELWMERMEHGCTA
jgi:N4-gp56 family major capsid protein